MKGLLLISALVISTMANASNNDYLIRVSDRLKGQMMALQTALPQQTQVEDLGINNWMRIRSNVDMQSTLVVLRQNPEVLDIEPNKTVRILEDFRLKDKQLRNQLMQQIAAGELPKPGAPIQDNPEIPSSGSGGSGMDPDFSKQWGMNQMNVRDAWQKSAGRPEMVVAVIDTGVDYTHEDLVDNLWRNPGETGTDSQGRNKASNGVDDDNNGYVDDLVGWDFVSNDNKPYDLYMGLLDIILKGGNPGHGTHCAGNVAARANNGKGISGVAPNIRMMAVRFLSEKGEGTLAGAVQSIKYAVDNGARVMSNSWGSEGDDGGEESRALQDAITHAQNKGVLFIAAAGNGHQGKGYDNDSDAKPGYPASYDHDIIVSVAAIDASGNLGSFSNWGARSVDLGAPGVVVYSTVPGNRYQDTLMDLFGTKITWDGTSMATPHVAGAAALYWSLYPNKTWQEVKAALLGSVKRTTVLNGKTVSGGQLDVQSLMNH